MDKTERRRLARARRSAAATRKALLGEEIGAETDRSYVPDKRRQRDDRPSTTGLPGWSAQNWITVPPRTRGTIADAWQPPTRLSFSEGVIARHDPSIARSQMVESTTVTKRDQRNSYTGAKSLLPEATDRQAQTMRDELALAWEVHHAPLVSGNALREGRAQYRPDRTSLRSTVKLGDGKALGK
jgi:hypothetical protein